MWGKNLIAVLITVFCSSAAFSAVIDITCERGDCLTFGWKVKERNFVRNTIRCVSEDCEIFGWEDRTNNVEFSCRTNGCFTDGWNQVDFNGRILSRTMCNSGDDGPDCLNYGWETLTRDGYRVDIKCTRNDCRNDGWRVIYPNGTYETAVCKAGGCFLEGWEVFN